MSKLKIFFIIILGVIFLSGCAGKNQNTRLNQLENELRNKQRESEAIRKEKDMQIEKLQLQLERKIAELEESKERELQSRDEEIDNLKSSYDQLERELQDEISKYQAKLTMTERGLVITFIDEILFRSGKSDIETSGQGVLDSVADVLNKQSMDSMVCVEGHTDNVPITYSSWKSNWELSCARALAVLHYFVDKKGIQPQRLSISGFGEYSPVVSNETPQGRMQNRRVEIVILPEKLKKNRADELPEIEVVKDEIQSQDEYESQPEEDTSIFVK